MQEGAKFIHLHTHSHYSLLEGLSKIKELISIAKEDGMPALGLTDYANFYGAIEFYKACLKAEIKPILGADMYIAPRSISDQDPQLDARSYSITLLAENFDGYQNLIKLITLSQTEGLFRKPRVDKESLKKNCQNIICLSGNHKSDLSLALVENDLTRAEQIAKDYINIFGKENYFLELCYHPEIPGFENIKKGIIELSQKLDLPIVGTYNSHYLKQDDKEAFKTMIGVSTHQKVDDVSIPAGDYSFITTKEAYEIFKDIPEAIKNTNVVADRCNLEITIGKFVFPKFDLPPNETGDSLLEKKALVGMSNKGLTDDESMTRLRYELDIIKMKGYSSYFLVVEDLIRYARENNIYYNIRGSVAGSITTYVLNITSVNPLEYKIPFERFLNPERPSAPDIDMDFADNRRDEIIQYAKQKYGEDKVAQIGTFGTMAARGSVKDVARALGYPYGLGDRISKLIPPGSQGFPMTIKHALEITPELKEAYDKEREVKTIIDMAQKIEGSARHISVHAAGVVISPESLINYTPLQPDPKGDGLITQYDMYSVGEDGIGLTKFDFLGIRNLSILADAVAHVEKERGIKVDLDNIPLDDEKTFKLLSLGQTEGVFQLNGAGMTRWLKELEPSSIHDINAMVALYRPGPMQFIPNFIAGRKNPEKVSYPDPAMKKILGHTYGVLVYQDDLLIMAHDFAGYSWGEVDKFRKAVGKKIPEEMAAQKEKFIKGCMEHSKWSKERATEIWTWIEPFAAYGFNKAHSVSYGRVAYQTAYMKANFPVEYMTAIMTAEAGDVDMIERIINECRHMHIKILPPDINQSKGDFSIVEIDGEKAIRFGLFTIKNVGTDIASFIIENREKNGKFTSLEELIKRMSHQGFNKKNLESLAKVGALDSLANRSDILNNLEKLLTYRKNYHEKEKHQNSLFGDSGPGLTLEKAKEENQSQMLSYEKELLGVYLSGHPTDKVKDKLQNLAIPIKKIMDESREGATVVFGAVISSIKYFYTKKRQKMAFIRFEDYSGSIEAVAFPETLKDNNDIIQEESLVAVSGKVTIRREEKSIAIEKIKAL